MKKVLLTTALASVVFATAANAGLVTITLTTGNSAPFDNVAVGTQSGTTLTENGPTTFATTGGAGGSFVTNTSVVDQYSQPLGDTSNYIFATPGSTNVAASDVDIGYNHAVNSFKILWGSPDKNAPDTYNLITLSNGDKITGGQILALTGTASGDNAGTRWWEISDTTPFTGWTASAAGIAFEFDLNYVSNVPESSTWAMMLIGFAGLGFAGLRTAKKSRFSIS